MNLARYHKPSQLARRAAKVFYDRVVARLPRNYNARASCAEWLPGAREVLRECFVRRTQLWESRSDSEHISGMLAGEFCFLNEKIDLRLDSASNELDVDWDPSTNRLWRFHLQSHEHLLELVAVGHHAAAWQIIDSWLKSPRHQTPFADPDAWHPFCISRRLPVWLMIAAVAPPPPEVKKRFWSHVAQHAQWLFDHLELDLGGNHLLENLHALVMVTSFATGDWNVDLAYLDDLLKKQCREQILASGEHFERTPTYHVLMSLALEETAVAYAFRDSTPCEWLESLVDQMQLFLAGILHPDGNIPLLGDSAFSETPCPQKLIAADIWGKLEGDFQLDDYWTWHSNQGDYLICDTGPIACDYLPAHGHCDLLNIEASVGGRRLIVDSGVFDYEVSDWRSYCRSTQAHNTLQVDDEDHADTWSSFRMGRRGHPTWRQSGTSGALQWVCSGHDAYQHLGVLQAGRLIVASKGPVWLIVDWVDANGPHKLTSRLQLHPDVETNLIESCMSSFSVGFEPIGRYTISTCCDTQPTQDSGWYCPSFGVSHKTLVLKIEKKIVGPDFVAWSLTKEDDQVTTKITFENGCLTARINDERVQVDISRQSKRISRN